jgi:hypothetical protein
MTKRIEHGAKGILVACHLARVIATAVNWNGARCLHQPANLSIEKQRRLGQKSHRATGCRYDKSRVKQRIRVIRDEQDRTRPGNARP